MRQATVTCDQCGCDLTTTTNAEGYRISLSSEPIPHAGGFATLVKRYPQFDTPKHFCGVECLGGWVRANVRQEPAVEMRVVKTKNGDG